MLPEWTSWHLYMVSSATLLQPRMYSVSPVPVSTGGGGGGGGGGGEGRWGEDRRQEERLKKVNA